MNITYDRFTLLISIILKISNCLLNKEYLNIISACDQSIMENMLNKLKSHMNFAASSAISNAHSIASQVTYCFSWNYSCINEPSETLQCIS